jgi:putative beta barrel porin BBP7
LPANLTTGNSSPRTLRGAIAHDPVGELGVGVVKTSLTAISLATAWGAAAVLAGLPIGGPAGAADLPLVAKAPPKGADAGNPFWIEIDALGWTVKGDRPPPLVTTSPAGTPFAQAGVLGAPGTSVLFGDSAVNGGWRAGGQLRAGYWFDPQHNRGIEASFFDLQSASTSFATDSGAHAILAQPFFDAVNNLQNSALVAFPGVITGAVAVNETSRLLGAGALYRQEVGTWGKERISALIGYRYLRSSDKLSIPVAVNFGFGPVTDTDAFNATSNFHGVDIGLAGEWKRGPWTLEWRGKVALGANFNSAQISGSTTADFGGGTTTVPGGLLALSSNIGNYSQTRFSAVPELALKAGYQVAPQWRLVAGYDVLYWTGVQRSGGLIDSTINPNLIPLPVGGGPQRPQPVFNTSPLLAQGFSVGMRYDY